MNINWIGEGGDLAISLLGKYARWLNCRTKRSCFLFWIVCSSYWIYRDLECSLYTQAFFNAVSIGFHCYGWHYWSKNQKDKQ